MDYIILEELFSLLRPHSRLFDNRLDEVSNNEAKLALQLFYNRIKEMKPERKYRKKFLHVSYMDYLIRIRNAFNKKDYIEACNELESLIHYEPILQSRIYYNLINMLEDGLALKEA